MSLPSNYQIFVQPRIANYSKQLQLLEALPETLSGTVKHYY